MSVLTVNKTVCETFFCTCAGAGAGIFTVTEKAKGNFFCSVYSAMFRLVRAVVRLAAGLKRVAEWVKFYGCAMIHFTGVRRL